MAPNTFAPNNYVTVKTLYKPPYLRISESVQDRTKLLLISNRKSHTRFRLVPNQRPWMTLNWPWTAIMRSVTLHGCLLEHITKIWMKIDPYYQRQKCSPGIAVSSKNRFMRIFAGVRWSGGFKSEWGGRKWWFSLLSLAMSSKSSHARPHLLYIVLGLCSPLVAPQWHRNKWPWMSLNDHFALKSVSGSVSNGLAFCFSDKTVLKFSDLCIYSQRQKCSAWTGDISFMRLFTGVPFREEGASNRKTVFTIHSFHTCCSLMSIFLENK